MTMKLGMITIDTADAMKLGGWWAEQLGATVGETNDGYYVMVSGGGLPGLLSFQKVDDPTPGKNRCHAVLWWPRVLVTCVTTALCPYA